jgi:Peroxidase
MKSPLALLILTLACCLENVQYVNACPYLEGRDVNGIIQDSTVMAPHDSARVGMTALTETPSYTRGGAVRRLKSKSKLGTLIKRLVKRLTGNNPAPKAPAPVAPVPSPMPPPLAAPVASAPVSAPLAPPKAAAPIAAPVAVPVSAPVTAPASAPAIVPGSAPAIVPPVAPKAAPVTAGPPAISPKAAPIAAPVVVAPVSAPALAPVSTPLAAPALAPVVAPVSAPVAAAAPTAALPQVIAAARSEIVAAINAQPTSTAIAAKLVRLSFHDCVGGCDGCVDMSDLDNTGLDIPINILQPIVAKYAQGANALLTRADIWALAGLTAAANAQIVTTAAFPLTLVRRPNCANFPNGVEATRAGPARTMPSAQLTSSQLVDFFATNFGFSADETVAIMGAHTLYVVQLRVLGVGLFYADAFASYSLCCCSGRAVPQNSGFNGNAGWGPDLITLNNNFYTELIRNGRAADFVLELQTNVAPFTNKFLWRENGRPGFMLNADMALAVDTAGFLNATSGAVSCSLPVPPNTPAGPLPVCPNSPLLATANRYANNNAAWVTEFRDAFTKMVNTGCNAPAICAVV